MCITFSLFLGVGSDKELEYWTDGIRKEGKKIGKNDINIK